MIKTCFALAAALALSAIALPAAATTQLADGGFETQGAQVGNSYCYLTLDCNNGGPWTGANGGGLQSKDNTAWPGALTPDGNYYAFTQNEGYIQQTFTVNDSGTYNLSWLAAGRPSGCCQGNETYDVTMGSNNIFSGATTTDEPFTSFTSNPFVLQQGDVVTLRFQGTSNGPDNTAFLDAVSLNFVSSAVPEPAGWALMIVGFGGIGVMARTRRRRLVLAA
jgi:hypothetical protein